MIEAVTERLEMVAVVEALADGEVVVRLVRARELDVGRHVLAHAGIGVGEVAVAGRAVDVVG